MRALTTRDQFQVSVNVAELIVINKPKEFGTVVFIDSAQRALNSLIKKKWKSEEMRKCDSVLYVCFVRFGASDDGGPNSSQQLVVRT